MSLVTLDRLTKRYPGSVMALDALTLTLEPGVVGLVGANGAGKSTLIEILLGLLDASSGMPPPASAPRTCCATGVSSRSATVRWAATRPG